jgi:hypothetical protein
MICLWPPARAAGPFKTSSALFLGLSLNFAGRGCCSIYAARTGALIIIVLRLRAKLAGKASGHEGGKEQELRQLHFPLCR